MKTYKRELALALLIFWGYVVETSNVGTVEAITPWIFLYTLGAFGIDAYSKQIKVKDNKGQVEISGDNKT